MRQELSIRQSSQMRPTDPHWVFPFPRIVIARMHVTSGPALTLLLATVWLCGCAAPSCARRALDPTRRLSGENVCVRTVYLVRHGWHTSLAFNRREISTADWPESLAFQHANFIEVGWGDEDYLCSDFLNPLVAVKAGCLPSHSAIHVAGFQEPPETFFDHSQIIEIKVTPEEMRKLCRFIHESYGCDKNNCPIYLGQSLYGDGGIYRANGCYYVPKTCNVWTAKALAAADLPVAVPLCTFAQPLVWQSKSFGREVQKRSTLLPVIYPFCNFDRPQGH